LHVPLVRTSAAFRYFRPLVKAGRVFRGHPKGMALIGPARGGNLDSIGLQALAESSQFQTAGFNTNSHRW
jgi:hypothetical protein